MGEPRDREATNHNLNHLGRSYKYNNESFVKYNFIQKPRKKIGKTSLCYFRLNCSRVFCQNMGRGTQMPTKSQAGTHIWASSSSPPARVLLGTMPRLRLMLQGWYCRMHNLENR